MEEKHTKTLKNLLEQMERDIETKEKLIVETQKEIKLLKKDSKKLTKLVKKDVHNQQEN